MLSSAFLAMLVAVIVQWGVKPLLALWIPQTSPYQNSLVRLAVASVAVGIVELNAAASAPLTLAVAWSLLPSAAAVAAGAIATWHCLQDTGLPLSGVTQTITQSGPPATTNNVPTWSIPSSVSTSSPTGAIQPITTTTGGAVALSQAAQPVATEPPKLALVPPGDGAGSGTP